MEADNLTHGRRGEARRILVAEVRLFHERELREVLKRPEVGRFHVFLVATGAEELHALVLVGDNLLQFDELEGPELSNGHIVWL